MKKNYNIIKDYFKTIKPNKKYTIFLFLTALFSQLLIVIVPLIYGTIIKLLTNGDFELFYNYLILYGVVLLSSFTLVGFNFKVFGYFYRFIYTDIQSKLISKLNKLNIDYFSSRSRGKFLNISNDDANVLASFGDKMNDVLVMFLYVVFAQIIIFYLNFYVGLVVLFINFVNIFIMDRANDKAQKNIKKKNIARDKMTSYFNEAISGIKEIKTFNIMSNFKKTYLQRNEEYNNFYQALMNNRIIRNAVIPIIYASLECLTLFYLALLLFEGKIGIDIIIIIISYYYNMRNKLQVVMMVTEQIRVVKVSLDRYNKVMNFNNEINYGNISNSIISGDIIFQNVSFNYDGKNNVLNNLSFVIPKNSITAIVGVSGSGKSTIFNLLLRFYKPNSGKIMMDEIDIYDFSKEAYSHNLSVVMQQPFVFNMSIRDNLALIDEKDENIKQVCKQVYLDKFINSLEASYETIINEDARDISGGQKQRLAIARALLKGSKVILLDEITSSLDRHLSNNICDMLDELKEEKTIVMISHKLEEIKRADNIVLIKDGQIVAFDSHDNLILTSAYYRFICGLD